MAKITATILRVCTPSDNTRRTIDLMRAGMERGLVLPAVVLKGYAEAIEPHIVGDAKKELAIRAFSRLAGSPHRRRAQELTDAAAVAVRESVVPAYRDFLEFMNEEYVPAARGTIGASALPCGASSIATA